MPPESADGRSPKKSGPKAALKSLSLSVHQSAESGSFENGGKSSPLTSAQVHTILFRLPPLVVALAQ